MLENTNVFIDRKSDDSPNAGIAQLLSVLRKQRIHICDHEKHEQSRKSAEAIDWRTFDAGCQHNHRFKLIRPLGKGATSTVFLAEDRNGKLIALKVPRENISLAIADNDMDERAFTREAEIMKALCHPGICRIIEYESNDDQCSHLAMEWINGPNLAQYWNDRGTTLKDRIMAFIQTCEAVNYMHKNSYIHGDIRPENILVTHDEKGITSRLIDFGSSFRVDIMQQDTSQTLDNSHTYQHRCIRLAGLGDSMGLSQLLRTLLEIESDVHDNHDGSKKLADRFSSILHTPSFDIGHLAIPSPYTIAIKSSRVFKDDFEILDVHQSYP